jgi:hypothetical protein
MALIRSLALVVLVPVLAAGCSQSLFDNPGSGGGDGGDGPDDERDGGMVTRDGGGGEPDAAVPDRCPSPCVSDAVAEFSYEQGGTSGSWRYFETQPDEFNVALSEMTLMTSGPGQTWVGSGAPPPAILSCSDQPDTPQCAGLEDSLSLVTTSNSPASHHPALQWTVPYTGTFRLSGAWRSPDGAPTGVPHVLLVSRLSRFDSVFFDRSSSSPERAAFDFELHAVQGDVIGLTAIADAPEGVPVGMRFYASQGQSDGLCQMGTQFADDGNGNFEDLCGSGRSFVDNAGSNSTCDTPPCPATQEELPPFGATPARRFVEGSSMQYADALNDYSGDWTVQFWANFDGIGVSEQWLLADFDCAQQGGVAVFYDTANLYFEVLHEDPASDYCAGSSPKIVSIPAPAPENWHFFRMVRNQAQGTVSVCMDGAHRGTIDVPPEARMPSGVPMSLGRRDGRLAYFRGALHDLRVFRQALPCPSLP